MGRGECKFCGRNVRRKWYKLFRWALCSSWRVPHLHRPRLRQVLAVGGGGGDVEAGARTLFRK
jgi:hypothetical protein